MQPAGRNNRHGQPVSRNDAVAAHQLDIGKLEEATQPLPVPRTITESAARNDCRCTCTASRDAFRRVAHEMPHEHRGIGQGDRADLTHQAAPRDALILDDNGADGVDVFFGAQSFEARLEVCERRRRLRDS